MANNYEIAAFDVGWGPRFGSMVRIERNDKIRSFTINLSRLPKSTFLTYGIRISSWQGRTVRGAIWICNNGWSLSNPPDFISVNSVNTNEFEAQTNPDTFTWYPSTFYFDNPQSIDADRVILGLYTNNNDLEDTKSATICYQKDLGSTLYYMRDLYAYTPEYQLTNTCGIMFDNIDVEHYYEYDPQDPQGNKPTLQISNIKYRTLSQYDEIRAEGSPVSYSPEPTLDNREIKSSGGTVSATTQNNPQWNTTRSGHEFSANGGFDFKEGCLKDVTLFNGLIDYGNITHFNNSERPYWTHHRSRIMFTFPAWENGSSRLRYTITGTETKQQSVEFVENSGSDNTLLICPRDEGIEDNSAWSIEFVRYSYDRRGRKLAESTPLVFHFNTFVTPEVRIAHPKPIRNKTNHEMNTWGTEEYNYVLWANDVTNNQEYGNESRNTRDQICDALSLLLTKDGGDNSEYPIFTRVYVQEIEGHFTGDATTGYQFNTPSNDDIKRGASNVNVLATWTGVILDDGSLVQLSGMTNKGFNWDTVWEDDNYPIANTEFPLNANPNAGEVHKPPYHPTWVDAREDVNGNPFSYDPDDPMMYMSGSTAVKMGYAVDKRMCFRAGCKYLIRVRRFHSTVAGAIGATQYNKTPWKYEGFPTGGTYNYENSIYNESPVEDPTHAGFYKNGWAYPFYMDTSTAGIVDWLDKNNRRQYMLFPGTWPLKWEGPYDGAGGKTLANGEEINNVYPGQSAVDYVILDCINTIYTNKDIISPRPAIQEYNANGWISFAYRHLAKNMAAIDDYHPANAASTPGGDCQLSGKFQQDGSPIANTAESNYYGSTWGGVDNTATRIYNMYKYLIGYILHALKPNIGDWENSITAPPGACDFSVVTSRIRIYLDKQGFHDDEYGIDTTPIPYTNLYPQFLVNENMEPVEETINPANKIILYQDNYFDINDGTLREAALQGFMNPANRDLLDSNVGGMEIFYDRWGTGKDSKEFPPYGNTYSWVPIINATNNSGNTNIKITHTGVPNMNRNYGSLEYGGGDGDETLGNGENSFLCTRYYTPDTYHCVIDQNTYQTALSNKTENFPAEAMPIKEYSGSRDTPHDSTQKNLFIHEGSGQVATTPNVTKYYGTSKDPQGIQYFNMDGIQCSTGELYKRVPLSQDSENGVPTSNRLVTPLIKIKWPLVRTSHLLYFTTYTFGEIKYDWIWVVRYGHQETDDEGNVYCTAHQNYYTEHRDQQHESFQNLGQHVTLANGKNFHILQVYGEDNGGAGRLLSADNDTTAWFDGSGKAYSINNKSNPTLDGAIEIPIRVRYTPLVQPIITTDPKIVEEVDPLTTPYSHNIISVVTAPPECGEEPTTREYHSQNCPEDMRFKEKFYIYVSYGMLLSTSKGRYISLYLTDDGSGRLDYHRLLQRGSYEDRKGTDASGQLVNYYNYHKVLSPGEDYINTSTDFYPAVGICNSYLVLLIPNDARDEDGNAYDYTRQVPNWFSDRSNYEDIASSNNPIAKTVIVSDLAFTDGETVNTATHITVNEDKEPIDPIIYNIDNPDALSTLQLDHQLRTLYKCEFNYHRLIYNEDINPDSGCTEENRTHKNKLIKNTWYDLVVVPVYSNHAKRNNIKTATFDYEDGAGYISNGALPATHYRYGGSNTDNSDNGAANIDYYGSTPLVVRKFLKIDNIRVTDNAIDENGDETICRIPGPDPGPDPDPEKDPTLYNWTLPAIIYPNVNNHRFSLEDIGYIKECPGFWLNNTFRVIMRGPHFRSQAEINAIFSNSREISVEEATDGELEGTEGARQFKISDVQVHIGKYDDVIKDGAGNIVDNRIFNSKEFQDDLILHSSDVTWMNERGIYSMRFNSNAFSKCSPDAKQHEDTRDVVLGGDLKPEGANNKYSDRFFEFCPHLVNATTPYPEGYYIQFRYLNNEYTNTTSGNGWSSWFSGLVSDNIPNSRLSYYVPIRNYNDIYTAFRSFIKESFPGSGITDKAINVSTPESDTELLDVVGQGTQSPRDLDGTINIPGFTVGNGNPVNTPVVPSENVTDYDENGEIIKNSDHPYPPQIWDELLDSHQYEKYKNGFPVDSTIDDTHRRYWEMCYIDYIISNMIKLYYSGWNGAYINENLKIEPKHFGWTQALKNAYRETNSWSTVDVDIGGVKPGEIYTGTVSAEQPTNRDKYFRKPIVHKDFQTLLDDLKKLVTFVRNEQFTGVHTDENDTFDSEGRGTGGKVIMIDPELLDIDIAAKGIIGHDANYHYDENQPLTIPVDSNYIRILMDTVMTKIINLL